MSRIAQILWLASSLICGNLFAQSDIRWAPDLATARQAAAQFQVPLLVHFYGDNCLPCKTLEQRVYKQEAVIKTLNKYFICVRLNGSQTPAVAAEFRVHSWPTDVFLSPDGQTLYQGVSKQDIAGYMEVLQSVAVMNRDRNTLLAAERTKSGETPNAATPNQFAGNQIVGNTSAVQTASSGLLPPAQAQHTNATFAANPAISGSTPASSMQVAPPSRPSMMDSGVGLPPLPAHLASKPLGSNGLGSGNVSQQMAAQPNLPFIANNNAANSQKPSLAATNSQLVGNPYYPDSEAMVCTPDGKCGPASSMLQNTALQYTSSQPASQSALQPTSQAGPYLAGTPANSTPVPAASQATSTLQNSPMKLISTPAPSTESQYPPLPLPPLPSPNATSNTTLTFQPKSASPIDNLGLIVENPSLTNEPKLGLIETTPKQATEPAAYNGYCPIALVITGQKVQGSTEFAIRHRGRTYLLQNADSVKQFMQAPDRFSPILSGYDPMVFLATGQLIDGTIEHALHDPASGTVILFATADSQKQFKEDPARNAKALSYILNEAVKK